jgi:hypothetical protein
LCWEGDGGELLGIEVVEEILHPEIIAVWMSSFRLYRPMHGPYFLLGA